MHLVGIPNKLELLSEEDAVTEEIARQGQLAIALTKKLIGQVGEEVQSLKSKV